jgi:putative membrane protein
MFHRVCVSGLLGDRRRGFNMMRAMWTLLLAIVLALGWSQAFAKDDKAFLKDAIQGNFAEVALGQLALEKSQDPDTKSFAQMLVDDHSANNAKAQALAQQFGMKPPTGAAAKHQLTYARFKVLSGAAFDRQFAKHMVEDHKQDISMFEAQTKTAKGPVADFARETLPALKKHLQTAEALQRKVVGSK